MAHKMTWDYPNETTGKSKMAPGSKAHDHGAQYATSDRNASVSKRNESTAAQRSRLTQGHPVSVNGHCKY